MNRKFLGAVVVIILIIGGWFFWDLKKDHDKSIKIIKEISLYSSWEPLTGQKSIAVVAPGEALKVLRIKYGKDHMAIKVEKNKDIEGWLIYNADSVELIESR